jgi:predicted HicB family RNase H-like nuclease
MANLKSSKGERITRKMIDDLAAEAEAGYDPKTFQPRRVGRPSLGKGASRRVTFRVSAQVLKAALQRAHVEGTSLSELARRVLEQYLKRRASSNR